MLLQGTDEMKDIPFDLDNKLDEYFPPDEGTVDGHYHGSFFAFIIIWYVSEMAAVSILFRINISWLDTYQIYLHCH